MSDPDALLNRGLDIVGAQLNHLTSLGKTGALPPAHAMALAGYIRALSAVKRDRSPNRGGAGKFAGKTPEQLRELARQDPELAEALGMLTGGAWGAKPE